MADTTGLKPVLCYLVSTLITFCLAASNRDLWKSTLDYRTMPDDFLKREFIVIGAGLSRTGTLSTRSALEQILGGKCYHGSVPVAEQHEHLLPWIKVFSSGNLEPAVATELLAGYVAGLDVTVFNWYKNLMEIYPEAKVLLTVRDPERWLTNIIIIVIIIMKI